MNAKPTAWILIVALLALSLALAGCVVLPPETPSLKPTIPATPAAPSPSAMPSGGVELTILATGSGVTVLEYQGSGVRCIIASGGAGVDMVCQNSATVPVQPTPTEEPKQAVPNGSSEA